jgi:replicative DNA helicase
MEEAILSSILVNHKSIYDVITVLKPNMFYKESNQYIFQAMINILNDNKTIDLLILTEYLRKAKQLEFVGGAYALSTLGNNVAAMPGQAALYAHVIAERWMKREQISINSKYIDQAYDDSFDSFENVKDNIAELEMILEFKKSALGFNDQLNEAVDNALREREADDKSYYMMHDEEFSHHMCLQPDRVVLLPSNKGEGKTSFLAWMADGLLTHNKNISILWFCFEDSVSSMIQKFISMRTNLTAKQLNAVNYTLTSEDKESVLKAKKELSDSKWNIEFVDDRCTIAEIRRRTKQHKEKFKGLKTVIIIDNFGLIDIKGMKGTDVEKENEMAREISLLKKETKSCIIIPHHLNKEANDLSNATTGYRVTDKHIRGSGRIMDYFPQCITVVRPGNHKDIVEMYKKSDFNIQTLPNIPFNSDNFDKYIWNKNPKGDRLGAFILLKDMYTAELQKSDPQFTFATVIKKWHLIINETNKTNAAREDKYKSKLPEFEKWLQENGHLKDVSFAIPCDSYYYADMPKEKRPPIENLFIVESIRDRFESQKVFRFKCNMQYNQFERI